MSNLPRVAILLLFMTALIGLDRLAFRDIGYFYTPLYDYVAARMHADWLPLWNPLDQTGVPLIGETTTAVFYPLRWLLFALPLSSDVCLSLYVVVHLLIASATARYAARQAGVSKGAATIAAVVYPMSGSVLFLYTNPPFLVGAAWLPLLLSNLLSRSEANDKKFASRRIRIAAIASAMMILGGDPQTLLNGFIVVIAALVVRQIRDFQRRSFGEFQTVLIRIGFCALIAVGLSLPQIAGSLSWSQQSDRVREVESGNWLDPPSSGSRRQEVFAFSVAPWHAVDFLTANASGSLIPRNHRLGLMMPGEGKMWTPSLYMGLLVALAFLTPLARLREEKLDVWFGIAIATWFAAMGHFGLVWYMQNLFGAMLDTDSAAGGLYWWLYSFFPGYDSLRYPAKWLPLTAISLSIVTARFVDRCFNLGEERLHRATRRMIVGLAAVLVAAWVSTVIVRLTPGVWSAVLDRATKISDPFWGPLNADAGLREIQHSLAHSLLVLFALGAIFQAWTKSKLTTTAAVRFLIVVVTVDLFVFGSGIVYKVNRKQEQQLLADTNERVSGLTLRTKSKSQFPASWRLGPSEQRLLEVESTLRTSSFGRWHLAERQAVFNSMVSIQSDSVAMFWEAVASELRGKTPQQRDQFWQAIRKWLAINRLVHADDIGNIQITSVPQSLEASYQLTSYEANETSVVTLDDFRKRLAALPEGPDSLDKRGTVEVLESKADSAIVFVECEEYSSLQRNVIQDGHWRARLISLIDGRVVNVAVERSDFLKQRIAVPAGHWQVTFWYAPWWLLPSIAVCMVGWAACLAPLVKVLAVKWHGDLVEGHVDRFVSQ
ncbi:hypothetical protein [Novipirellula aureliae]|nr:hypothetical protein [Novipirellula aureliae]